MRMKNYYSVHSKRLTGGYKRHRIEILRGGVATGDDKT